MYDTATDNTHNKSFNCIHCIDMHTRTKLLLNYMYTKKFNFLAVFYNINLTAELSYFILSFKNSMIFPKILELLSGTRVLFCLLTLKNIFKIFKILFFSNNN